MNEPNRVDAGVPAGGQFAATAHAEPGVTLQAPEHRNQPWYDVADEFTANGATPEKARTLTGTAIAIEVTKAYLNNTRRALAAGDDTSAALYTIAFSSLRDLPGRLNTAGDDTEAACKAVTDARRSLRSAGSLLDGLHPSGRQPIFKAADDVLADLENFLPAPTAPTEGTQP